MDNLPQQLKDHLRENGQLVYDHGSCECGKVVLKSLDELQESVVWLDASYKCDRQYIEIPCISLIRECDGYDPEGILIWLPNERVFGTWDCDHWSLKVFPKVTWANILLAPAKYLNAQWYDYDNTYSKEYYPVSGYKRVKGWPI